MTTVSSIRHPRLNSLACLLLLSPMIVQADWAQWTLDPKLNAGFEYNDNFNVTKDPTRVWFSRFSADFLSKVDVSRFGMDLHGRYYGERYISVDGPASASGNKTTTDDLSRDDGLFDANLRYSTEYILWELEGGRSRDQPSSNEFDGTVFQFNRITRNQWNVGPALTWIWSPQTSLRMNYGYSETFYKDRPFENSFQSDYTSHSAAATLTHAYTEYTELFSQVFFSNFQTTLDPNEIPVLVVIETNPPINGLQSVTREFENNQIGAILGINHSFSETFTASLSGGGLVLFSSSDTSTRVIEATTRIPLQPEINRKQSDTAIGFVANINVKKSFEYTTLTASADHKLTPTANGNQLQLDSISLGIKQRLLEHLDATLSTAFLRTDTLQDAIGINQTGRTNYRLGLRFNWQFDRDWSLDWGYNFFRQEREDVIAGDGNRNAFFVNLHYQWPTELLFP